MPPRAAPGPTFFFEADLVPAPLGFEGREASSAASWASRSAFLRAASAFLTSVWSLESSLLVCFSPCKSIVV